MSPCDHVVMRPCGHATLWSCDPVVINRCNKHEMWFIAKKNSLLSPDRTPIILHNVLINFEVLGSMGPRTSIHIGKKSKEGRAFSHFLIFSSDALIAAKPHSLLGVRVQPSGRLPSCTEMPDGSFKTGIEALEKSRQM
ncbi:hypothetical protein HELRODRAFT_179855 [Helobdella robusta]|uniref:Uncharacterized protein n=1 Tax=Helobdella robusta TaxID=6412 RepID=T1FF76_HELRO|nr:hypothetical protein HELRODRAFT_179855 [Helobdella robusta]ESN95008.1 hypothetical protein HELRODRAFT_179855 [Helobdella robusta]